MKSKILFGALLGGIALASCTADDELNSLSTAQTSPIKFSVSLDNGDGLTPLTRSSINDDWGLSFDNGDLMSLFHGISDPTTGLTGYQNAIYEGHAEAGKSFEFTTKSMVLQGGAVMVYPADTTFANNGAAAPVIKIAAEQNANTKNLTPYMSEILNIQAYDDEAGKDHAGYGKYYNIVLKRVGTSFTLVTVPSNTDKIDNLPVAPLKVSKVEMNATAGANGVFTTAIPVAYSSAKPFLKEEKLWTAVSEVDLNNVTAEATLTTTDVTDNYNAVFTLLPAPTATTADNATITIRTNYGFVTLTNGSADADKIWDKDGKADKVSVAEGINFILSKTWTAATSENSSFKGENIGKYGTCKVDADMSTLDMDNLHITDENHLMDALKVYDAIYANRTNKAVTFILDGDANGEFVMNADAMAAYEARVANKDNKIQFKACVVKGEAAKYIKFVSTTETEIPEVIKFLGSHDVKLAGSWKYSEKKDTYGVGNLIVTEGSTLTLKGEISNVNTSTTLNLINNGAISVDGEVDLTSWNVVNNGTVTIPQNGALFVGNQLTLTNNATSLTKQGVIDNNGSLGVRRNSNGKIYNYGLINQKNADAYTYVTKNATDGSNNFATAFSTTNKIGSIVLFDASDDSADNTVVAGNNGFIKIHTNVAVVAKANIGKLANYVVVGGACTEYKETGTKVAYIEIQSSKRVVFSKDALNLTGLVVAAGKSMNIPSDKSLIATTTFVAGRIYAAGTFNSTAYTGYLGGKATDEANVIFSGSIN